MQAQDGNADPAFHLSVVGQHYRCDNREFNAQPGTKVGADERVKCSGVDQEFDLGEPALIQPDFPDDFNETENGAPF